MRITLLLFAFPVVKLLLFTFSAVNAKVSVGSIHFKAGDEARDHRGQSLGPALIRHPDSSTEIDKIKCNYEHSWLDGDFQYACHAVDQPGWLTKAVLNCSTSSRKSPVPILNDLKACRLTYEAIAYNTHPTVLGDKSDIQFSGLVMFVSGLLVLIISTFFRVVDRIIVVQAHELEAYGVGDLVRPRSPRRPSQLHGEDLPTEDYTKACVICRSNVKCCVVVPCGHLLYCIRCANQRQETSCPMCMAPMRKVIRVFS